MEHVWMLWWMFYWVASMRRPTLTLTPLHHLTITLTSQPATASIKMKKSVSISRESSPYHNVMPWRTWVHCNKHLQRPYLIAHWKWNQPYGPTVSWLCCRLSFSLCILAMEVFHSSTLLDHTYPQGMSFLWFLPSTVQSESQLTIWILNYLT